MSSHALLPLHVISQRPPSSPQSISLQALLPVHAIVQVASPSQMTWSHALPPHVMAHAQPSGHVIVSSQVSPSQSIVHCRVSASQPRLQLAGHAVGLYPGTQ